MPDAREAIREAVLDLCFERGFRDLSSEDVCERAGISRAEFDRRYADVEAAYCDFFEEYRDAIVADMIEASRSAGDWRDRVRATAYVLYRRLSGDPRLAHFSTVEIKVAGERAQRMQFEAVSAMFELLDEGISVGKAPPGVTRGTAEALSGAILSQISSAAAKGPLPPEQELVPQLMYMTLLPYLGREAAREELFIPPPPRGKG